MNELSIFVDESGDFGSLSNHSPFYLFSLVFHEQNKTLDEEVQTLDKRLILHNATIHAIHTGPLLRREDPYRSWDIQDRKIIFKDLFFFAKRCPITYQTVIVDKREINNNVDLSGKLSRSLSLFLHDNMEYFISFDKIIIYYDNGQVEISKILSSIFNAFFNNVDFRQVYPIDYKLFQVADLICTLELVNLKFQSKNVSRSETSFFGSFKEFKKFYLKGIRSKHFEFGR